nr:DUF922 domain-containing protein [uncultured Brevundimonas sp.]
MILTALLFAAALQITNTDAPAPLEISDQLRSAAQEALAFPNTRLIGYPVTGRFPREIRASINAVRPADAAGVKHDAMTLWNYRLNAQSRNGVCHPSDIDVDYDVTITLPDLQTRDRMHRTDRDAWDRYMTALVKHEVNHARIVRRGAELLQDAVRSAATCEEANTVFSTITPQINAASDLYDRQTDHGAREGATFPQN